jgi:hypothetical protein
MLKLSMRRALLPLLVFAATPLVASAQDEYLFSTGGPRDFGGFGGPIYRVTQVGGETMSLGGGGGAMLINRRYAIGGMGIGGTSSVDAIIGGTPVRGEMDFGYGGLTLEVITRPSKLVHATYGLLLGAGGVSVWPDDLRPRNPSDDTEAFGVTEPQIGLEVNLVRWMRIGVTGGYRFTFGADVPELVDDKLSGASGSIVFRFGKF